MGSVLRLEDEETETLEAMDAMDATEEVEKDVVNAWLVLGAEATAGKALPPFCMMY